MGGYGTRHGDALANDDYGNASGQYYDGAGGSQTHDEDDGVDGGLLQHSGVYSLKDNLVAGKSHNGLDNPHDG